MEKKLNAEETLQELNSRTGFACPDYVQQAFFELMATKRPQGLGDWNILSSLKFDGVLVKDPVIHSVYGDINTGYPYRKGIDGKLEVMFYEYGVALNRDCLDLVKTFGNMGIILKDVPHAPVSKVEKDVEKIRGSW